MNTEIGNINDQTRMGYDAACRGREHDHLNRWGFAREIYRIAADGPRDWSVRIGIYGEWGSGKTSVLNFVDEMVTAAGHVVFRFNPWQFQRPDDLWKAFVRGLYSQIDLTLESRAPGTVKRGLKSVGSLVATALPKVAGLWNESAGDVCETGLGWLQKYLVFDQADLKGLNEILGARRIIVAVDDLDRTEAQLVPEIFFALKEIMDIPGMAFVCAFDPVVVGRVLGNSHPGYGDGLRFLEKIIDYPRWLPEPSQRQLAELAVADAARTCPFVPPDDLRDAIRLLPPNPRAIRQYIRLLALLKPQIERHYPSEIHWSVLMAANVLKVRFPKAAQIVLDDTAFWQKIYSSTVMPKDNDELPTDIIGVAVNQSISRSGIQLEEQESTRIQHCVEAVARRVNAWHGLTAEVLTYQFRIAESPAAVTAKEFDEFFAAFQVVCKADQIVAWCTKHAADMGYPVSQVYSEILHGALARRLQYLGKAADEVTARKMNCALEHAAELLNLIEMFFLNISRLEDGGRWLGKEHLSEYFEQVRRYFGWRRTKGYRSARRKEEQILKRIFNGDRAAIHPWLELIGLEGWSCRSEDGGPEWKLVVDGMRADLKKRCARWIIGRFAAQAEFLRVVLRDEEFGNRYEELFLNIKGPVWVEFRAEFLKVLSRKDDSVIQNNAYDLLDCLVYHATEKKRWEGPAKAILSSKDFSVSVWNACMAQPLNPRAIGSLRGAHKYLTDLGMECKTPAWWNRIVQGLPPLEPQLP